MYRTGISMMVYVGDVLSPVSIIVLLLLKNNVIIIKKKKKKNKKKTYRLSHKYAKLEKSDKEKNTQADPQKTFLSQCILFTSAIAAKFRLHFILAG